MNSCSFGRALLLVMITTIFKQIHLSVNCQNPITPTSTKPANYHTFLASLKGGGGNPSMVKARGYNGPVGAYRLPWYPTCQAGLSGWVSCISLAFITSLAGWVSSISFSFSLPAWQVGLPGWVSSLSLAIYKGAFKYYFSMLGGVWTKMLGGLGQNADVLTLWR